MTDTPEERAAVVLPELPEADYHTPKAWAAQMHSYAIAAVLADRAARASQSEDAALEKAAQKGWNDAIEAAVKHCVLYAARHSTFRTADKQKAAQELSGILRSLMQPTAIDAARKESKS